MRLVADEIYLRVFVDGIRRFLAVAGLLAVCAAPARAQYRFERWDTHNGLPQTSVTGITQTPDGYLWLATRDGLVRYDGIRFTVFNKARSAGMDTNRLSAVFSDRKGRLWIGTDDGRLIARDHDAFRTFGTAERLTVDNRVFQIRDDSHDQVWVTTPKWIARLDERQARSSDRAAVLQVGIANAGDIPHLVYRDAHVIRRFVDGRFMAVPLPPDLRPDAITVLGEDQYGGDWIATGTGMLYQLVGTEFQRFPGGLPFPADTVTAVLGDRAGRLWVGTKDALAVLAPDGTARRFRPEDGLVAREIRTLFEDSEGTIWIGDGAAGLTAVRSQVFTTYGEHEGLSPSNIYTVIEDSHGAMWLATWPKGVSRYSNGRFTWFGPADGIATGRATALYEDVNGDLLAGAYGGLHVLRPGTNRFELLPYAFDTVVSAIYRDAQHTLWVGTSKGLFAVAGTTRRYTVADGLPHNVVRAIADDRHGGLWVGTQAGIAHVADGSVTALVKADGLGDAYVRSLYVDADDTLWVGTYESGLARYKNGRFTRYTTAQGLFDDGVFQILDDGRSNLWMSSNRGIYRVSKSDLNAFADGAIAAVSSVSYGRDDGIGVEECNGGHQPAGWKSRDGRLWFPTQAGVAVVDPAKLPVNSNPPPVAIETVLIDDRSAPSDDVRIPPGQHSLEIQYAAPSFVRPHGIRFKYRLEGLDREWINAGMRRSAQYSRVPPGTYRFSVIAANSDGVWNTRGAALSIVVVPSFWQTWWFQSLSGVAAVGLLAAAYRRRIAALEREQGRQQAFSRQLIESQERERARVAAALHDSVGQSLLVMKNRALLAMTAMTGPDDAPAAHVQLAEISNTASEALEEVREIANNLRPYQVDRLGLTRSIQSLIARVEDSTSLALTVHLDDVDQLFPADAEVAVYRIVQEGLTNVIKHAEATEASVTITRHADRARIVIRDNGRGFSQAAITARNGRTAGIGLMGLAERVRMLGGERRIESDPDCGTAIVIELPVGVGRTDSNSESGSPVSAGEAH
jgi:signal transduction histidine kinase/ligand-binding sensor domain-containing protein